MYIYLLTFQSDMNIILLPYKKASLHDLQKIVPLHYTFKKAMQRVGKLSKNSRYPLSQMRGDKGLS